MPSKWKACSINAFSMKKIPIYIFGLMLLFACQQKVQTAAESTDTPPPTMKNENIFAWCIVPFDSVNRSPQERIDMLQRLNISSYAYDWRTEHMDEMQEEWKLAKTAGIDIKAVWMWIDQQNDSPEKLSDANEFLLAAAKESGLDTELWVGFHQNYFAQMEEEEAIAKGMAMVSYLETRARESGLRLALYNHGDWFGEPENQLKIIQRIPEKEIGIIYNFHHGHEQIDRIESIAQLTAPYLWAVNLNGMIKEGPKILPIGQGEKEWEMMAAFEQAGYQGPWGILGHVMEADVELILKENLAGLASRP